MRDSLSPNYFQNKKKLNDPLNEKKRAGRHHRI